ncbi:MAG: hypothetical protein L6N94_01105 [Candidatus Methylarchaceae archaeon HK01M]|nr:hypothetical protein [Candidatus Methylarchaceae archaeon HK01M]
MQMMGQSKIVVAIIIVILLFPLILPVCYGQPVGEGNYMSYQIEDWMIVETDIITVAIPSDKTAPMFVWWYNDDDSIIYVVRYEGLAEAWLFASEQFRHNLLFDDTKDFKSEFMEHAHEYGWVGNSLITPKINKAADDLHPFFFSFYDEAWDLITDPDMQEIKAQDGKVIGLAFAFILKKSTNPEFDFTEDNILIINRIYFVPVEERIGESGITLFRSELKSDIVISNWQWNYDIFMNSLGEFSDEIPDLSPKLILSTKFNIRSVDEVNRFDIMNEERYGIITTSEQRRLGAQLRVGDRTVELSGAIDEEGDIIATDGLPKLKISAKESIITGFFRFNPKAIIVPQTTSYNEDQSITDVKGIFWAINGLLKIFIVYDYFDDNILRHDPSIGVSSPGLEDETPQYVVDLPLGTENLVPPSQSIISISTLLSQVPLLELVMAGILFTIIIAMVIAATKKSDIEVLDGR